MKIILRSFFVPLLRSGDRFINNDRDIFQRVIFLSHRHATNEQSYIVKYFPHYCQRNDTSCYTQGW